MGVAEIYSSVGAKIILRIDMNLGQPPEHLKQAFGLIWHMAQDVRAVVW